MPWCCWIEVLAQHSTGHRDKCLHSVCDLGLGLLGGCVNSGLDSVEVVRW